MTFERLLSPIQVGPRTLRNRVQVTSHTTCYVDDEHLPTERDADYFAARARGGAALLVTGTAAVHASSPLPYGVYANFDDAIVPRYRTLSDGVHRDGALILAQLGHMAQRAYDEPVPIWSPSAIAYHSGGRVPHEMTAAETADMVGAFAAAASRAVAGGLDGVELAFGHGQLVNLFLSPLTNQRTDRYGGSLAGRMRFSLEVLHAVREAIGPNALLGIRVNGADEVDGGLDQDAWVEISRRLAATGVCHYLNVSANFLESVIPTMHTPHGVFARYARTVRAAVELPVFGVGRVVDPELAEELLAHGALDVVGMTRAHIADPDVVRKVASGQRARVRPCIGCAQACIGNLRKGRPITCVYNAVTGWERSRAMLEHERARSAKRVVVVGGGPAGLEAARVAALRGHQVTLFERSDDAGGAALVAARVPGRGEFARLAEWLQSEVELLGVDLRLGREAAGSDVADLAPDAVVVATGAYNPPPTWAADDERVLGDRRVIADGLRLPGRVAVVDGDHHGRALFAAAYLMRPGTEVTVVSDRLEVGGDMERMTRNELHGAVLRSGGELVPGRSVASLECAGDERILTLRHFCGSERMLRVDWVVTTASASDNTVVRELAPGAEVHVVGDARAPRQVDSAVHEAFMAAASI